MPATSTTPFTRLWKCPFDDCPEEDNQAVIEEYIEEELAEYLSAAHVTGCSGPDPIDQPKLQLLEVPISAIVPGGAGEFAL